MHVWWHSCNDVLSVQIVQWKACNTPSKVQATSWPIFLKKLRNDTIKIRWHHCNGQEILPSNHCGISLTTPVLIHCVYDSLVHKFMMSSSSHFIIGGTAQNQILHFWLRLTLIPYVTSQGRPKLCFSSYLKMTS